MPILNAKDEFFESIARLPTLALYPISLGIILPFFMATLVKDKESHYVAMMKMNGLKIRWYWLSTFCVMFLQYTITAAIFYYFGLYFSKSQIFLEASGLLVLILMAVWGYA